MPSFLQPLIDDLAPDSLVALVVALFWIAPRWGLVIFLSCIGVFDQGTRGKNARVVLKLLLRKRPARGGSVEK